MKTFQTTPFGYTATDVPALWRAQKMVEEYRVAGFAATYRIWGKKYRVYVSKKEKYA